jgi:hypothetical protein
METILTLLFLAGLVWLALGGWRKVQDWMTAGDRAPPFSARPMLNNSEFRLYRTLERWRWLNQGPRYLKIGGRVVYRLEDVEAFENEVAHQPEAVGAK